VTTKVVTAEMVGLVSTEADVGLVFCVFLPDGGTVIADVGRLVFDAEGNVSADRDRPGRRLDRTVGRQERDGR
jgi:hypothetical protein